MNLSELIDRLFGVAFLELKGARIKEALNNNGSNKHHLFSMTLDELRAIDHRIPAAIEGQLAVTREIGNGEKEVPVFANLLRRTFMIWQGDNIVQTVEAGPVALQGYVEFDYVNPGSDKAAARMTLYGSRIEKFTSREGITIDLSKRTLKETFTLCPSWLNTAYPGWQQRYAAAFALGYEGEDLVNYVLPQQVLAAYEPKDISGLTFD